MDLGGQLLAIALTVVFIVVPGAFAVWMLILPALRMRRMRAAERAPLSQERCLACDQTDLEVIAPGVARCRACGFAGGDGIEALQRRRRLAALERLEPRQRRALAVGKLKEAQLLLSTAHDSLAAATSASVVDIVGLSIDRGEEKQNAFGAAVRIMRAAFTLATEAAEAVRLSVELAPPTALEESTLLLALDTMWLTDGIAVDLAAHEKIRKAKHHLGEMSKRVDGLLLTLSTASTPDINSL